jgi:hypothetical protein
METQFTSQQVAAELNTDAKSLRRFLRATPEWANPGSGGRYSFTKADITQLRKQFPAWVKAQNKSAGTKRPRKSRVVATPTGAAVVPASKPTNRRRRADATADLPAVDTSDSPEEWTGPLPDPRTAWSAGEERAARLDQRLRATGQHLSQWTADRWAKAGVS